MQGKRMSSENHTAPVTVTLSLTMPEWGVVLSALYEAALPMKLTAPIANKVSTALASAQTPQRQHQEGTP